MLKIYTLITSCSKLPLEILLRYRLLMGKEDPIRVNERRGNYTLKRPSGRLVWLHAASVGEAQSAMVLIHALLEKFSDIKILVTTGTKTSAQYMEKNLPERAFHQFMPLDHPKWGQRFLDHWKPDCVFWMESELWPNMLMHIKKRNIPALLINARLSHASFQRWSLLRNSISEILSAFTNILTQTENDAVNFKKLGAKNVIHSGNLKYSAAPLSCDEESLKMLQQSTENRQLVVYASTHDNEEEMAANIHLLLEKKFPKLLSIIIPRHPERGTDIYETLQKKHQGVIIRGHEKRLPDHKTRIYIANTLGEMGLFYRLSNIVYVGRSLSKDGGGGHNPLEPALLNCAVLHGSNIQNLQDIYDDMLSHKSCIAVQGQEELVDRLDLLLSDKKSCDDFMNRALTFANTKTHIIDIVLQYAFPMVEKGDRHGA